MYLLVNGQKQPLSNPLALADLLRTLSLQPPFAVAWNGEFVARGSYGETLVSPGDRIDIVHPAAGG